MSNTANSIMTPQAAVLGHCNLAAVTACTTRGPTATASLSGANIVLALANNASADQKISKIAIKGISTSITAPTAANVVGIWHWDGTNAYLVDEIIVTVVTPSTTAASFYAATVYDDFVLPAGHALYMSVTVTTTASTTALQATIHGASM